MTDLLQPKGITDHDLFVVQPHDHHPEVEHARVQVNGIVIAPGDYEYRIAWLRDSHRITEAILAGSASIIPGGKQGAWGVGTQVSAQSNARFISGTTAYTYVASFSRLHGDTHLTTTLFGDTRIRWKDIYLDGDETVLVFTNTDAVLNKTLRCWGLVIAK